MRWRSKLRRLLDALALNLAVAIGWHTLTLAARLVEARAQMSRDPDTLASVIRHCRESS